MSQTDQEPLPGSAGERPPWACPMHGSVLAVGDGELACDRGHVFPCIDGIPRFVDGPTYADAFGAQWLKYRTTQLDSRSGLPLSETRLRRCLGESLWHTLDE